jgi:ABC-type glycerol-3-phosphate transport system substrate-binding protein
MSGCSGKENVNMQGIDSENTKSENANGTSRHQISIFGYSSDSELVNAVKGFNASNDAYELQIVEYDTDRLSAEIASGKGPDLLPISIIGLEECAQKSIVEDLNVWIDKSDDISESMLNPNVLELFTLNDRLVCIPPSFSVQTLFGRKTELGDEAGWTGEEMLKFVDSHRGKTILEGTMRGNSGQILILTMWDAEKDEWVDWENNAAHFDSDDFSAVLKYASEYESDYDNGIGDTESRWQAGDVLLYTRPVTDIWQYLWIKEFMKGDVIAMGYPSSDGMAANKICAYGQYGINVNSENKEGAWEFIKYLILNQNETDTYQDAIPVLNDLIDKILQSALENEHIYNECKLQATEADINEFNEMINNMSYRDSGYGVIYQILDEELIAYFSGEHSMEDTVDVIQNRVQLYLDENE